MEKEESFGVVPLKYEEGEWKVLLIQHKKAKYWGFPKGHKEGGETPSESAFRELKEETNLDFVRYIESEPILESYQFLKGGEKVHKTVLYFVAEVEGELRLQPEEIFAALWLPLAGAVQKVTHKEAKDILTKVQERISS